MVGGSCQHQHAVQSSLCTILFTTSSVVSISGSAACNAVESALLPSSLNLLFLKLKLRMMTPNKHGVVGRSGLLSTSFIISTGHDSKIFKWNLSLQHGNVPIISRAETKFEGHTLPVYTAIAVPATSTIEQQPKLVVTSSWDESIRTWNMETGEQIQCVKSHQSVWSLAWWYPSVCLQTLPSVKLPAQCLIEGPHGPPYDINVRAWKIGKSNDNDCVLPIVFTLKGHKGPVYRMLVDHAKDELLTCGDQRQILLWNLRTRQQVKSYEGHTYHVTDMCYISSTYFVSVSYDKAMKLWDKYSGKCLFHIENAHDSVITAIQYSASEKILITTSYDKHVNVWQLSQSNDSFSLKITVRNPFGKTCTSVKLLDCYSDDLGYDYECVEEDQKRMHHTILQTRAQRPVLVGDYAGNMFTFDLKTGNVLEAKETKAHDNIVWCITTM